MDQSPVQIYHLLLTLVASAASAFGATKYAIKKHDKELEQVQRDIRKTQESLTKHVSIDACRIKRVDCKELRRETSSEINVRFSELQLSNTKTQELLSDIMQKLVELKTKFDEREKRANGG